MDKRALIELAVMIALLVVMVKGVVFIVNGGTF